MDKRTEPRVTNPIVDKIIAYEYGEMTFNESVAFFQELYDTNLIYGLQGSYQRTFMRLVNDGLVRTVGLEE